MIRPARNINMPEKLQTRQGISNFLVVFVVTMAEQSKRLQLRARRSRRANVAEKLPTCHGVAEGNTNCSTRS